MLRIGKINETILKRSVLKNIKTKRKDVILGPAAGEDASVIDFSASGLAVTSIETVTLDTELSIELSVNRAVNNIAASGAEAIAVSISVLLPLNSEETVLKAIISETDRVCGKLKIALSGGHTEVTDAVARPVITVSAIGKAMSDTVIGTKGAKPGDDIVVTKFTGISGTAIIAKEKKNELLGRFSPAFVERGIDCINMMSVVKDAEIAVECKANAMHDISYGGIFAALRELGEASKVGLSVNLLDIPIMQETVEICEIYGINPYELMSDGALIITGPNGLELVDELEKNGIRASIIGKITSGNDRLIINGDEVRYIDISKSDEINKIF